MLSVEKEVAQVLPACGKEVGTGVPWRESTGTSVPCGNKAGLGTPCGEQMGAPCGKEA